MRSWAPASAQRKSPVIPSEVEGSRSALFKVTSRDPSTPLGMTMNGALDKGRHALTPLAAELALRPFGAAVLDFILCHGQKKENSQTDFSKAFHLSFAETKESALRL